MSQAGKEIGEYFKEKRAKKEPERKEHALQSLKALGYEVVYSENEKCVMFIHNGNIIRFYPYTAWFTGKGVKDGRGLANLLKQLKK